MQNGYYLSSYISIDKIGNLYNILSNRHDMAVALWKKEDKRVELIRYWELERFSRIKHHGLPFFDKESAAYTINNLLKDENLSLEDINEVWGSPKFIEFGKCNEGSNYYLHSIAHLFSSMLIDTNIFFKEKILALAVDLRSDNETEERQPYGFPEYVGCFADHGKIELFNIVSPAILWSICKNEIGMQEGSLMALASATQCRLRQPCDYNVTDVFYYPNYKCGYEIYKQIFNGLSPEDVQNINSEFSIEENLISAGMKEINKISQSIMEHQINLILEKYSLDSKEIYLSISGGFGLNCPTNSHLMKKYNFKGFLGAPCMDDSGEALGIGLYYFYKNLGIFDFKLQHAFYGKEYKDYDNYIIEFKKNNFIKSIQALDADTFVNDIKNSVIVWYDSSAEIGPRALGHRSLLGDPRKIETKHELNHIKQRQFWRPVAPIILKKHVNEWFEDNIDSPYMLHTSNVKEEKRKLVPAILHYDNSARLQTISQNKGNDCLYSLINAFYENTGVPMLCNTSLNDKGEPIVNTPYDSIRFALSKKISVVYINRKRIELQNFDDYNTSMNMIPEINLNIPDIKRIEEIEKLNPYHLNKNILLWRNIFDYDITTKNGANLLRRSAFMLYKNRPDIKHLFELV